MFTSIIAKSLRLLPNQARKTPMIPLQEVEKKTEILVETSVQPTYVSLYKPLGSDDKKLPVYVNFHGGAFIMHEKEMDDPYCRFLANQTGYAVLNVDYAKAPEFPFPKPIEQSYEIIQWIKRNSDKLNIDQEKIMVGGQSSGANIAAALCLYLEEKEDKQPLIQVLSCPMLDFVTPHADKPEPDPLRARYPQVANFLNMCYVPEKEQAMHPLASPVCADVSKGLATALILIAEHDAFRPEAERYAGKLKKAGIKVYEELFKDCFHGFTHLGPKEKAEEAWMLIAEKMTEAVESGES
ncbi:alpha/beta hydrolase [Planococcus salinus]|uniref:Alpha/beta hydrolase n=1 Tax=Planococcus salinus TaxID=1848460 RepID=A0A3M8PAH5_9BACL|nr:alpha/beta hydrolase [Planococcus salinus]RNF40391.1 alpha/beta hydrolase [Planococcus salinus]